MENITQEEVERMFDDCKIKELQSDVEFKIVSNAIVADSYDSRKIVRLNIADLIKKLKAFRELSDSEEVFLQFNEENFEHNCDNENEKEKICLVNNYVKKISYPHLNSISFTTNLNGGRLESYELAKIEKIKCILQEKEE